MFFHGWASLGRAAFGAVVVYVAIVLALRLAGSRALAKMSGYDLVVTVALGSLIASIPLMTEISLVDGIAVIVVYLALQEGTRWLQEHSSRAHHLVRQRPFLAVWGGQLLDAELHDVNITADEVRAAVRRSGFQSMSQVQAVILENDGQWAVIPCRSDISDYSALHGIRIPERGFVLGSGFTSEPPHHGSPDDVSLRSGARSNQGQRDGRGGAEKGGNAPA